MIARVMEKWSPPERGLIYDYTIKRSNTIMQRLYIFIALLIIILPFVKTTGQVPPEQLVPLPDFAGYEPEFSHML